MDSAVQHGSPDKETGSEEQKSRGHQASGVALLPLMFPESQPPMSSRREDSGGTQQSLPSTKQAANDPHLCTRAGKTLGDPLLQQLLTPRAGVWSEKVQTDSDEHLALNPDLGKPTPL